MPTYDGGGTNDTKSVGGGIYYSFISRRLFPYEQKRWHKEGRGIGEILYFQKHTLKENKTRRQNVA